MRAGIDSILVGRDLKKTEGALKVISVSGSYECEVTRLMFKGISRKYEVTEREIDTSQDEWRGEERIT